MPGTSELLIIFGVMVLLFGASKLPKLGGAIGESIKNFKKGIASDESSSDDKKIAGKDASHSQLGSSDDKHA